MLRFIVLITALALAACDGDGGTPPPPSTPIPTSVAVSPSAATLEAIGATTQLSAQVRDQNGAVISGQTASWSSSATDVATVSASGLVTAVSAGSAQITAEAGNARGMATVTVDQVPAAMGKVAGDGQAGVVGSTLPAQVTVSVTDARGNSVEGETVTFAVTSGGGAADPGAVATGADGRAATTWTLGILAGEAQTLRASAGGVVVDFNATALPGPAETLSIVSGDGQTGFGAVPLAEPLVVSVKDAFGNGVADETVTFSTAPGNGTVSPAQVTSDAEGNAQTTWTLDENAGVQTVSASIAAGETVEFTATSNGVAAPPVITSVTPSELVEGGAATIQGENFAAVASSNTVRIDGVTATVTGATTTALTVTVPTFACRPARTVDVEVTSNGLAAVPAAHPLRPAAFTALEDGSPTVITGGGQICVQLPADAAGGDYLVGVQNFSENANLLTPVRLGASVDPTAAPVAPLTVATTEPAGLPTVEPVRSPLARRLAGHRQAEARLMDEERRLLDGMDPALAASPRQASGPAGVPDLNVGATATLRVRDQTAGATCSVFTEITATVWARTANAIWFHDNANPANGFTQADVQALAADLDPDVFQSHAASFGPQPDIDENDRVAIIITEQLNIQNGSTGILQAFVSGCDVSSRTAAPASNEGETVYMLAPDPTGEHGQVLSVADALAQAPLLLAHEITHIVQLASRFLNGRPQMDVYYLEGQATAAEELVGHAVVGNQTGQNYLFNTAWNFQGDEEISWYASAFSDLVWWFGGNPDGESKITGAPEECTWLADVADPCVSRQSFYGVAWSLLRWIADQFYPANESAFHQGLIDSPLTGLNLLESSTGVDRDVFLPSWSAALYVDDREPVDPLLTYTSWNLFDVFEGNDGQFQILPSGRLRPRERGFTTFQDDARVRAGSTAYWRISGATQPGTAVRVTDQAGGNLPSEMTVYVIPLP